MADCFFCGKPAGFLRSKHSECAAAHAESLEKLPQIFTGYINLAEVPGRPNELRTDVEATAKEGFLSADEFRSEVIKGLGLAIRAALTDKSLSDTELARIQEIMNQFGLETPDIVASGARDLLVQGLVLRDLDKGAFQNRLHVEGAIPINLKKDEVILWIFKGVSRLEPKTSVSYSGSSNGVSFRIMKGVSYRVGASKGHRIETPTLASKGSGDLYITSSGIYFVGSLSGYTVAHKKISAVEQYSDGISIAPSSGRNQIFLLSDPRFAAELILKIGSLQVS
jgi:hypothetical protein